MTDQEILDYMMDLFPQLEWKVSSLQNSDVDSFSFVGVGKFRIFGDFPHHLSEKVTKTFLREHSTIALEGFIESLQERVQKLKGAS